MTFPVLDKSLELFDGFTAFLSGNGIVGASENRGSCLDTP